jgi:hypothetical protein
LRDYLYRMAAFEAERQGDLARALEIADKISAAAERQQVRGRLIFDAATRALDAQRFDEARRLALEVSTADQRAQLFCGLARAALKQKDRRRMAELLDEAEKRTGDADNTPGKLRAFLAIANLYAGFDPVRGLEVMAEAVRTANRLPDYDPDQARSPYTPESPFGRMRRPAEDAIGVEDFLGAVLARLARTDFDGALLLAQSLESKPLKLVTVITLASSILNRPQAAQAQ